MKHTELKTADMPAYDHSGERYRKMLEYCERPLSEITIELSPANMPASLRERYRKMLEYCDMINALEKLNLEQEHYYALLRECLANVYRPRLEGMK